MLFSPAGRAEPYWAETGFVTPDKARQDAEPRRRAGLRSGGDLTPVHPVTLT